MPPGTTAPPRTVRLLLGLGLVAAGAIILGAALTGADVQARGFDFREPLSRWLGAIVGLVALGVGVKDLAGALRPDR